MIHQDAIEQAVERQLEIERKAAAWDMLVADLREKGNTDAQALLNWMPAIQIAERGAAGGPRATA